MNISSFNQEGVHNQSLSSSFDERHREDFGGSNKIHQLGSTSVFGESEMCVENDKDTYVYPLIASCIVGYESHYIDLISWLERSDNSIQWRELSPFELKSHCKTLPLDWISRTALGSCIEKNCIDGRYMYVTDEQTLLSMFPMIPKAALRILKTIMFVSSSSGNNVNWRENSTTCASGTHPLASIGLVTDTSMLSSSQVECVTTANESASLHGDGVVYGQLLALGHTSTRWKQQPYGLIHMVSSGDINSSLVLRRKSVANGDMASNTAITTLAEVAQSDVYQLGRAAENDMVLEGCLHVSSDSRKKGSSASAVQLCGPVSRVALTVICERVAPYTVKVYAGGKSSVGIPIRQNDRSSNHSPPVDWLTTHGVRLWRPDTGMWVELTASGQAYGPRPAINLPGKPVPVPYDLLPPQARLGTGTSPWTWNTLCDGCVLDVGGVYVMYQSPLSMATRVASPPNVILSELNSMEATCPVLFQRINFSYANQVQHIESAHRTAMEHSERSYISNRGAVSHSYDSALSDNTEDACRPMVFPNCGHVHGYCSRLADSRSCPLCRTPGRLTALIIPFQPALDTGRPTHCFSPCGHTASLAVCKYWSEHGPEFFDETNKLLTRSSSLCRPTAEPQSIPLQGSTPMHRGNPGNLHIHVNVSSRAESPLHELPGRAPPGSTYPVAPQEPRPSSRSSSRSASSGTKGQAYHICPFCTQKLSKRSPYSRLIFQSESKDSASWSEARRSDGVGAPLHTLTTLGQQQLIRNACLPGGNLHSYYESQPSNYPIV